MIFDDDLYDNRPIKRNHALAMGEHLSVVFYVLCKILQMTPNTS